MIFKFFIENNNGMRLLVFKTILHKKCRSGKNSEGPAENSWVLDSIVLMYLKKKLCHKEF
jgi:hypothetical protein